MPAGADAADQMDAAFRTIIDNDPEIQAVIRRVWGNTTREQRPSDTPKALEEANHRASEEIGRILERKGIPLPDRTFINPRSGTIEGHRGWSGLNNWQRAAIIAAAAGGATLGAGALGAFGGVGGAGAGGGAAGGAATAASAAPAATAAGTGAVTVGTGAGAAAGGTAFALPAVTGAAATPGLWSRLASSAMSPQGVGAIASAATGMARGAEQDRQQGTAYQVDRDRLGLDAQAQYERDLQSRAELQRRQQETASQTGTQAFENAVRSAAIRGFQPAVRPKGVPTISFVGNGPQMARPAAEAMDREAMLRLMEGPQNPTLPDLEHYQLNSPTEMPGQSLLEKIAGPLGLAGTAYSNFFRRQNQNQGQTS